MSDIDTTDRAVEQHEARSGAHHTRYSDTEARTATDGVIDADTVDGQHAADIGPSLASENGVISYSGSGFENTTVSLANAYKSGSFVASCGAYNHAGAASDDFAAFGIQSMGTDANGNITSITIDGGHYGTGPDVRWFVYGETA